MLATMTRSSRAIISTARRGSPNSSSGPSTKPSSMSPRMMADNFGRISDRNHQRHSGMGLVEIDQSRWQEMARYRLAGPDREAPASKTGELAHCQFHGLGAIDQVARLIKQQLASF